MYVSFVIFSNVYLTFTQKQQQFHLSSICLEDSCELFLAMIASLYLRNVMYVRKHTSITPQHALIMLQIALYTEQAVGRLVTYWKNISPSW